jgi:hypothetical protein
MEFTKLIASHVAETPKLRNNWAEHSTVHEWLHKSRPKAGVSPTILLAPRVLEFRDEIPDPFTPHQHSANCPKSLPAVLLLLELFNFFIGLLLG